MYLSVCALVLIMGVNIMTKLTVISSDFFIRCFVLLSIPIAIMAFVTVKRRAVNNEKRLKFLSGRENRDFSFGKETKSVLKSGDFIAEMLAFLTIMTAAVLITRLTSLPKDATTLTIILLIGGTLLASAVLFAIIDVIVWVFVRKAWLKSGEFYY